MWGIFGDADKGFNQDEDSYENERRQSSGQHLPRMEEKVVS